MFTKRWKIVYTSWWEKGMVISDFFELKPPYLTASKIHYWAPKTIKILSKYSFNFRLIFSTPCLWKWSIITCQRYSCDPHGHGEFFHGSARMTHMHPISRAVDKGILHLVAYPMMNVHDHSDIFQFIFRSTSTSSKATPWCATHASKTTGICNTSCRPLRKCFPLA